MFGEQALGEAGEDERVVGGLGREGDEVLRGDNGARQDGGTPFGGDPGQFGAQTAARVAGRDQNEGLAEVQGALEAILGPFFGQNGDGGRQRRGFPSMEMPGGCHGGENAEKIEKMQ